MEEERPLLNSTVQTLSKMTKDLEKQLEMVLSVNEALEKDLEKEKRSQADIARERDRLSEEVERLGQEIISLEDIRAENRHLQEERSRLASTIEGLGRQLAEAERENAKLGQLAERMQLERDDAVEELQSVEAQFDRAMAMLSDLKARVAAFAEERDELVDRLKVVESQLQLTGEQRDALRSEVEESRKALDEIRRQVADACVMSQRFYFQEGKSE